MASKKALVRRPSPRLAEGIVTHIERQPVDYHLALKQWERYVEAMEAAGWEIVEVPPADDCPDAVFVEDAVVVFRNVAVITRPGADCPQAGDAPTSRRRSKSSAARINRIRPPGTLDGGDVLKVGDTIYVGQWRSDQRRRPPSAARHPRAARRHRDRRARATSQGPAPEVGGHRAPGRNDHRLPAAGRRPRVLPPVPGGPRGVGSARRRSRWRTRSSWRPTARAAPSSSPTSATTSSPSTSASSRSSKAA